jgi:hypothetical protein
MRLLLRGSLRLCLTTLVLTGILAGQPSSPARKTTTWKRYCQPEGGFCFKYPNSWSILGEVYDGNGVAVAPPQKQDRALWDAITVALVLPSPTGDEESTGLDGVIERASSGLRENGQDFQTLQRQERTVDHRPAQMLKVRYHEKTNARDWIEEMIFIEGPDNEIYSLALKCSPQNLVRLEPVLNGVLAGWTLPPPQAEGGSAEPAKPPRTAPPANPP